LNFSKILQSIGFVLSRSIGINQYTLPDAFCRKVKTEKEESAKSRILVLCGMRSNRDQAQAAVTPQPIRTSVIMVNDF
jgi:hypothetical protein